MSSSLRAPFVVTLAVAGLTASCSGGGEDRVVYNPPGTPASDSANGADGETYDDGTKFDLGVDATGDTTRDGGDAIVNPAECPATDPGLGANHKPCTAPASVRCSYEDLCPQHLVDQTQNVYACHDDGTGDHWTLVSKDYVPSCPATEPKTGDPCPCTIHMGFVACNYGACEDLTRTYAACKGIDTFETEWKVTSIACNPPEPDGGLDGDAADGD
jgi:hypothetical protein